MLIYDTVVAETVQCRTIVDTSSEELKVYGRLTVAADRNCGLRRDYRVHDLSLTVSSVPKLGQQ
jgi:hypothetical protein